jgi:hypothetical protein
VTPKSIVYICEDTKAHLYYHGAITDEDAEWQNGVNALFITDVQRQQGGYVARVVEKDGTVTTITVTPQRLTIQKAAGPPEVQEGQPG